MRKKPLKPLLITSLILILVLTGIYLLESFGLIENSSARLYFLLALILALIDILVSLRLDRALQLLKDWAKRD